jgi:hypothetical protein
VLERLFEDASGDDAREAAMGDGDGEPLSPAEHARRAESVYMPISREAGVLIYELVRACKAATVVEFPVEDGLEISCRVGWAHQRVRSSYGHI